MSQSDDSQALYSVRGSVSDVDMRPPMPLICNALFSSISTFATPPNGVSDATYTPGTSTPHGWDDI